MSEQINTGGVHHIRLTVTDIARSREFYTSMLGFAVAVEAAPSADPKADASYPVLWGGCVLARGNLLLGLRPVAPAGDSFDPNRVGLDHLSFSVGTRSELDDAVALFDSRGVAHGEIADLPGFGISILPFRDPDGVQLELTSPMA